MREELYIGINDSSVKKAPFKTLTILLLEIIILSCNSETPTPPTEEDVIAYLNNNHQQISLDLAANTNEFSAFDDHFEGKEMILLGENHATQYNEVIDTKLFQYLYHRHGVRVYLGETSIGMGYFINSYINSGFDGTLQYIMANYSGSFSETLHNRARLVRLKDFNLSLPENDRITYMGIDVEHQVTIGFRVFKMLIPKPSIDAPHPNDIADLIQEMYNTRYTSYLEVINAAPYFHEKLTSSQFKNSFQAYFPEYERMVRILAGIVTKVELENDPLTFDTKREQHIAQNLAFVRSKFGNVKMYGKWGASHIWKRQLSDNYKTFVQEAIANATINIEQVASIPIFYHNSFYADKDDDFNPRPIIFSVSPNMMNANKESPVVLFDLNEQGSPFKDFMMLVNGTTGSTTSYFDMAFRFSGSQASKPYAP